MSKRRVRLERALDIRGLIGLMSIGAGVYVLIDDAMKTVTLLVVPAVLLGIWLMAPYCCYYRRRMEKGVEVPVVHAPRESDPLEHRINPATGLPMTGGAFDSGGNLYGHNNIPPE